MPLTKTTAGGRASEGRSFALSVHAIDPRYERQAGVHLFPQTSGRGFAFEPLLDLGKLQKQGLADYFLGVVSHLALQVIEALVPIGPWQPTFSASATGVMRGMREYSYSAAILSLAMALDDEKFLGAELST